MICLKLFFSGNAKEKFFKRDKRIGFSNNLIIIKGIDVIKSDDPSVF